MKSVLFFRHGKSDWDADFDHDHERPLNKRGRKAAKKMGRYLAEIGELPDAIVSSSAVRALTTVKRAKKKGGWEATIRATRTLYEAGPSGLLDVIRTEPDTTDVLMLVGHEPTWSTTIDRFVGGFDEKFSTASIARVDLPIDAWREAEFGQGTLAWFVTPKSLP